jgi:hypothetical protein
MKVSLHFIILFALTFFSFEAISQKKTDNHYTKWKIGVEIGPNLTQTIKGHFYKDAERIKEIKIGISSGIILQYNFNTHFSLSTSIFYERKILVEKVKLFNYIKNDFDYLPYSFKFNYFTLPILARYYIKKEKIFFEVGTSVDYLFYCKRTEWNYFLNENTEYNNTKYSTRYNLNIIAGFGVNIPFSKKFDASFELRDNVGLININKGGTIIKINTISFLYSLIYNIEGKEKRKKNSQINS